MTNKEVIKFHKENKRVLEYQSMGNVSKSQIDAIQDVMDILDLTIEALKKQEPKRPVKIKMVYDFECPNCSFTLEKIGMYCRFCGQEIDWRKEDEH